MNSDAVLRAFKAGASMQDLAELIGVPRAVVEQLVREALSHGTVLASVEVTPGATPRVVAGDPLGTEAVSHLVAVGLIEPIVPVEGKAPTPLIERGLGKRQRGYLAFLRGRGKPLTSGEIAAAFGHIPAHVAPALKVLVSRGLVARDGLHYRAALPAAAPGATPATRTEEAFERVEIPRASPYLGSSLTNPHG